MDEQRALAYNLATIVDTAELDQVSGGIGSIFVPTLRITGAPIAPDMMPDDHH